MVIHYICKDGYVNSCGVISFISTDGRTLSNDKVPHPLFLQSHKLSTRVQEKICISDFN